MQNTNNLNAYESTKDARLKLFLLEAKLKRLVEIKAANNQGHEHLLKTVEEIKNVKSQIREVTLYLKQNRKRGRPRKQEVNINELPVVKEAHAKWKEAIHLQRQWEVEFARRLKDLSDQKYNTLTQCRQYIDACNQQWKQAKLNAELELSNSIVPSQPIVD